MSENVENPGSSEGAKNAGEGQVLDSEGRRIEKFCPKCYVFRTPKENYCIVCGTKLKEIKLK
ncbi:MAG: hypothetical protein JTT11_04385, partial [Candidatus Brockarchaeota archaeon]|nr:hypothetical protein [Candidatus Brockarchaeota archaeon]